MSRGSDRDRILAFDRHLLAARCDRRVELAWGVAYLTPSLPAMRDASQLWVRQIASRDAATLTQAAEQVFSGAGLPHVKLRVAERPTADVLAGPLATAGWDVDTLLFMVQAADDGGPVERVREVDFATYLPFQRAVIGSMPGGAARVEESVAYLRRIHDVADLRFFVVEDGDAPVAGCHLYRRGGVADIEEVNTLAPHRRRGMASELVRAAARAARARGDEIVFLTVDADEGPTSTYTRLGFGPLGAVTTFTRRVGA